MKEFIKSKFFTFCTYILLVAVITLLGFIVLQSNNALKNVFVSFFEVAENRSFDYRQVLKTIHRPPAVNDDIVVVAIDDASLELLWDKYGEWPIPRGVYADIIEHIEKQNPKAIIFDLMFIKSMRATEKDDKALVETMNRYNNIYTAMTFDNQPEDLRIPAKLPERLALNVSNISNVDIEKKYNFTNCRTILPELLEGNVHIGLTNVIRNNDGIIRKIAPLLKYQDNYYPYLTFGAGANYLENEEVKDFIIDENSNLVVSSSTIPLNKYGEAILNWYGPTGTHLIYPFYKVLKDNENKKYGSRNFENKIVIIGTTAMSLHDTKSVPVQNNIYPGVEVHATFFNNMLDNNFIKQTKTSTNIAISLFVVALVGFIVMLSTSTIFAVLSTTLFTVGYLLVSYYVMVLNNLWIPVVVPLISIIIAFALSYLTKYLIKSRDFEYQYRLATIDGLTELYNHRYFQDSLKKQVDIAKRYQQVFSLIIVDIDYFKKFNDTYGHQAGDAVLKQVALTLKKNSRSTDIVCRYGGEEMSIILPNTSAREALNNAHRICNTIAETDFQVNPHTTTKVTVSVGVATFPENAETAQDLIEIADKGLYVAKASGRNQVGKYR